MKIKINDVELNLNIYDADVAERLEKEIDKFERRRTEIEKMTKPKLSTQIRKTCNIICDFIDGVFGEGTAFKIFDGSVDLIESIKAYRDIISAISDEKTVLSDLTDELDSLKAQNKSGK